MIKLQVHGITSHPILGGSYALLLRDSEHKRFLPIVVGTAEAQSIQTKMLSIVPQRPMTHDLLVSAIKAAGMQVTQVVICKYDEGVYYAELCMADREREVRLDCRASDAVAVALRADALIFTTEEVMQRNAFSAEQNEAPPRQRTEEDLTVPELNEAMLRAAEEERYEDAARIQKLIKKKQTN